MCVSYKQIGQTLWGELVIIAQGSGTHGVKTQINPSDRGRFWLRCVLHSCIFTNVGWVIIFQRWLTCEEHETVEAKVGELYQLRLGCKQSVSLSALNFDLDMTLQRICVGWEYSITGYDLKKLFTLPYMKQTFSIDHFHFPFALRYHPEETMSVP